VNDSHVAFNFYHNLTGYTCDVSAGTCNRGDTQSELTALSVGSVECDDGSSCPTGTTCCKLSSGQYGCCPYPEAVCCGDGEHCCPKGTFSNMPFNLKTLNFILYFYSSCHS
jgi:hypothetical protein